MKPSTEPTRHPAPRSSRGRGARPSARSDRSPIRRVPPKPRSSRGRCTPSARGNTAASWNSSRPRAARHIHSPAFRTRNHRRKANRKTSRSPRPVRAVRFAGKAMPRARPARGRGRQAVARDHLTHPPFPRGRIETVQVFPPGSRGLPRACGWHRPPRRRLRPSGVRVRHDLPRSAFVPARWRHVPPPASGPRAVVRVPAAVPRRRRSFARARRFFSRHRATVCRSQMPRTGQSRQGKSGMGSSWFSGVWAFSTRCARATFRKISQGLPSVDTSKTTRGWPDRPSASSRRVTRVPSSCSIIRSSMATARG